MISLKSKDWQLNNIETIIFDKDGTFIDLHYFWGKMTELRVHEIIKRFSEDENNFYNLCLELGYDTKTQRMLSDGITAMYSRSKIIEIFNEKLLNYKIKTNTQTLENIFDEVSIVFYQNIQQYIKPIDSAIKLIKSLYNKNIQLGIVTSDSIESTNLTLKLFDWEKYFNVVIARESSPYTKESGEPTKLALSKLKANPKTTIMIGDTPMDYLSAKNANIERTILVATGQISKQELLNTSNYCLNSLDELTIVS